MLGHQLRRATPYIRTSDARILDCEDFYHKAVSSTQKGKQTIPCLQSLVSVYQDEDFSGLPERVKQRPGVFRGQAYSPESVLLLFQGGCQPCLRPWTGSTPARWRMSEVRLPPKCKPLLLTPESRLYSVTYRSIHH